MAAAEKTGIMEQLTELCERAASGTPVEVLEVQLRGAGKARLLRVYIDKPGGVTHGDCQLVSERLGQLLDESDVIPGDSYTLEVSSPGADRRLEKPRDFERVIGQKIGVTLNQPVDGQLRWEGKLNQVSGEAVELETARGEVVRVPLGQVQKASLKFQF